MAGVDASQPEFFLTAQAIDIAGLGEVERFQRQSRCGLA